MPMRHDAQRARLPAPAPHGSRCELLMWHGRLDNRGDLVRQLSGSAAEASSDGSLLVAAYERWGGAGLGRVIGDWSAVLSDPRRRAIVLASDFSGVRPLYYHHRGQEVLWSRSLEAMLVHVDANALDEQYVAGYLTVGGYPGRTPYADVHAVLPGYAVRVTIDRAALSAFWRPPMSDEVRCHDEREYEEQFRALFRDAVASRLQARAPVAAELSGGLDSSSVVCQAADLIRRGDVAESGLTAISYVHRGSRDVPFIGKVEEHCGLRSVRLSVDDIPLFAESDILGALPHGRSRLQQSAAAVARHAGATAFLTGQAGDQLTGNWLDDSLQVARPLCRGRLLQASRDALAWSRAAGVPAAWILSRASRAALPCLGRAAPLYQTRRHERTGRHIVARFVPPASRFLGVGCGCLRRVDGGTTLAAPARTRADDDAGASPARGARDDGRTRLRAPVHASTARRVPVERSRRSGMRAGRATPPDAPGAVGDVARRAPGAPIEGPLWLLVSQSVPAAGRKAPPGTSVAGRGTRMDRTRESDLTPRTLGSRP